MDTVINYKLNISEQCDGAEKKSEYNQSASKEIKWPDKSLSFSILYLSDSIRFGTPYFREDIDKMECACGNL